MGKSICRTSLSCNSLVIEPDADVKASRLDQLIADTLFRQAWNRKRRAKDNSARACEAVMADHAVRAGWSDQEICELLIASRRNHQDDFKSDPNYYARTIAAARASYERAQVLYSVRPNVEIPREEARKHLSSLLTVEVISIQQFHTDPRTYAMHLMRKGASVYVEFNNSTEMFSQVKLRQFLIDYASVRIPRFKNEEWDNVVQCIMQSVEEVESSLESTHLGACIGWLRTYLRKNLRPDMPRDGQISAAMEGRPAVLDGRICFSMEGLKRSIMLESSEQPPARAVLAVRLKQIGCEYQPRASLRPSGKTNTSRSLWYVPKDFKSDDESTSHPDDGLNSS